MRTILLLPLALVAAAAAGCHATPDGTEQTAFSVPARDLTLQQTETPQVEVASPVELGRPVAERSATHRAPRSTWSRPARRLQAAPPSSAPAAVPAARVAAPKPPAAVATSTASEAPDPHALAPGQSVTIIPVSSASGSGGPSGGADWTDQRPDDAGRGTVIHAGGHGGSCGGHGSGRHGGGGFRGLR